ncbi:uncharacterized protein TNCV_64431 [Trichonephila clavipes]|nr:uncharacterized protein TNCV_64431 [Trichonephila clavipes]
MPMFKIVHQVGNLDFACDVLAELATMCFQYGCDKACPAQSPDLNTIENLRDEIKWGIWQLDQVPSTMKALESAIDRIWFHIPHTTHQQLVEFLPRRIHAVLKAKATRGLLVTDHVILNHGQVTWTTPELAPPLLTTTPHQREDVSTLDRFNVHRCPTRRVFSGTGLETVPKQATVRYLYHSATAAT